MYIAQGKTKVQFVVLDAWKARLEAQKDAEGITMTDIVVKAVDQYIDRETAKAERRAARAAARG